MNGQDFLLIGAMLAGAGLGFFPLLKLVRAGVFGLALTILSVLGAVAAILFYASGNYIGLHPAFAIVLLLLGVLPPFLGGLAGALLGFLLRRRDDQRL